MIVNKGYKYRIYPNREQEILINKTFGCCRFIWNKMLEDKIKYYEANKTTLNNTPSQYKKEFEWLREVDALALANVQINLQTAYKNFFNSPKIGFPKWKCKRNDLSYTTNNSSYIYKGKEYNFIRLENSKHIKIPKLGLVNIKLHRELPKDSKIKSATISKTASGKHYISILVEYEYNLPEIKLDKNKSLGLDFSVPHFYIDSQGVEIDYPKFYRSNEKKLARTQKKLSRKQKGSNNRNKARIKVARIHEKLTNQRKDWLHKLSYQLANTYDYIFVEDINLQGMVQVLNFGKTINDQGFGLFRTLLDYKLKDLGKPGIHKIDKFFPSSKTCRFCGSINHNLTLSDRIWICPNCDSDINRDLNAAINIKNKGLSDLDL